MRIQQLIQVGGQEELALVLAAVANHCPSYLLDRFGNHVVQLPFFWY